MLKSGIIAPIAPEDVKFCGNTVLAQKIHTTKGLLQDKLKHQVNDECLAHGFLPKYNLPPLDPSLVPTEPPSKQTKYSTKEKESYTYVRIRLPRKTTKDTREHDASV